MIRSFWQRQSRWLSLALRLVMLAVLGAVLGLTVLVPRTEPGRVALATSELPPSAIDTAGSAGPEPVWPLPAPHVVVHGFDPPKTRWGAGHRGVDLLGRVGQPVRASKAGQVSFAANLAGRGVVVVNHGSLRTTYEPVSATVRVGQRVAAGQVVGSLTGVRSHCAPRACLHWGLLRGEDYLDPLQLVGAGPVRLVPLSGRPNPRGIGPETVPLAVRAGAVGSIRRGVEAGLSLGLAAAGLSRFSEPIGQ